MKPTEPLPLHHSWWLLEEQQRLDLGPGLDWTGCVGAPHVDEEGLAALGLGLWQCDLADDDLTWSVGVHDIFGLPRDARVRRADAVTFYADESRAAMERLRAYAIKHIRGFTLDALIRPATGRERWMRLIASPICRDNDVVGLYGVKRLI